MCSSLIVAQPWPAKIKMKVVDSDRVCGFNNTFYSQITDEVEETFSSNILPQLYDLYGPGLSRYYPASSCADIYQGLPSGYYWLNVTNEPQQVYCSLNENRCCNESDGK